MTGEVQSTSCSPLNIHSVNFVRFWKVFWVDATSAETIEASFEAISGEPEAQMSGIDRTAESVRQWIARLEHDWLAIFDNADCDHEVVANYIPPGNRGNIIFTSRNLGMGGRNITRE